MYHINFNGYVFTMTSTSYLNNEAFWRLSHFFPKFSVSYFLGVFGSSAVVSTEIFYQHCEVKPLCKNTQRNVEVMCFSGGKLAYLLPKDIYFV